MVEINTGLLVIFDLAKSSALENLSGRSNHRFSLEKTSEVSQVVFDLFARLGSARFAACESTVETDTKRQHFVAISAPSFQ